VDRRTDDARRSRNHGIKRLHSASPTRQQINQLIKKTLSQNTNQADTSNQTSTMEPFTKKLRLDRIPEIRRANPYWSNCAVLDRHAGWPPRRDRRILIGAGSDGRGSRRRRWFGFSAVRCSGGVTC
jgi:hypothetical protein